MNVKKCDVPYAMAHDVDSEGEDKEFWKMEPLHIGDIIRYIPQFDIGNTGNDKEVMIINVDTKERLISTSNMDVLDRMSIVKRIGCYDAVKDRIEPQNGVRGHLTDFKLRDESSKELKRELDIPARERLHDQFRRALNKMKDKIKKIDPSMGEFISDKYNTN